MRTSTVGPRRWCRESKSAHHSMRKRQWWAPWEVVPGVQEHPPFNMRTSMVGPLGSSAGSLGAPTIQCENINDGPPGRWCRRSEKHPQFNTRTSTVGRWEAVLKIRERAPFNVKTVMAGPRPPWVVRSLAKIRKVCFKPTWSSYIKAILLTGSILPALSPVMSYDP
jgi:hypothetical protein